MWEAISNILTSGNALQTIISLLILVFIVIIMIKTGMLRIKTSHVSIGMSESDKERTVIREQTDWTHIYLKGLEGKIRQMTTDKYGGYQIKYIIEICFDEIIKWITFNHIEDNEKYIQVKQDKICSLVYSQNVSSEFRTKEFNERIKRWVEEVIHKLIEIRKIYS